MENVIIIIADSLSYEENMLDDMPRLKARANNIISFNNYFAQAPYTEAATIPIYTGSNVTDYQGHMYNIKNRPFNINEIFQSLGYKTYNTLWFYADTLAFLRGLDEYDYMTSGISLDITTYRIDYFRNRYLKGDFSQAHMDIMITLLDDFFEMTQIYINDYYNKNYRFDLLFKYTEFTESNFLEFVTEEAANRKEYYQDKTTFISKLLSDDNDFFNKDYSPVKRSQSFQRNYNRINFSMVGIMFKQLYYAIKNRTKNNSLKVLKHRILNKDDASLIKVIRGWVGHVGSYPGRYAFDFLSAEVILNRVYKYLSNNKQQKNFVITHLMDTHAPFNYLSSEVQGIDQELNKLYQYQKDFKLNKNNVYRYSKLYIDDKIGKFIDDLEKNDMMQDTTIVITSDHGSSYLGKIFRNEVTSTFYDENYKIPLMIYNQRIQSDKIDHLSISKQFIPTLLDFLKVDSYDQLIKEDSIFKNNKDYIIFEYFGAGCPDYTEKSKLFCIRSNHYKIQYEHFPSPSQAEDQILAIYDLKRDPKESKNLKNTLQSNKEINSMLVTLKERIKTII